MIKPFLTLPFLRVACLIAALSVVLGACNSSDDRNPPELVFATNQFEPFETYADWCYLDHQFFFVRSLFLELYYWGDEIVDRDPRLFNTDIYDYFYEDLVSDDEIAPGRDKDPWSFYTRTRAFDDFFELGRETSFGFRLTFSEPFYEGDVFIAFTLAGSSADDEGLERGDKIVSVDGYSLSSSFSRDEALDLLYPSSTGESIQITVEPVSGPNRTVTVTSSSLYFPPIEGATTFNAAVSGSTDARVAYLQFNDHTDVAQDDLVQAFTDFANEGVDELILDLRYNSGGLLSVANLAASMIASNADKSGKYFARLSIRNENADPNLFPAEQFINFVNEYENQALPQLNLERVFVLTGNDSCSASEVLINGLRSIGVEVIQIGTTTCGKPYGFYGFPSCGYTYLPVAFKTFGYGNSEDYDLGLTTESTATNLDIELNGCNVEDDFGQALGDINEARLAAAINYIFDNSCPLTLTTLNQTQSAVSQKSLDAKNPKQIERKNRRNYLRNIMLP